MNMRKFSLITSYILLAFLFAAGAFTMNYMNTSISSAASTSSNSIGNPFGNMFQDLVNTKKPVNILVLGGDRVNANTDTILLVNFDPQTTKTSIMSIPRDTKVYIEGRERKVNFAYPHGKAKLAMETVSKLLNVNIKYYVYVDTSVFRNIVDKLGGVKDFYVPANMDYDDPTQNLHIHIKKGVQDFDGAKAEQYMRFRQPNGKFSREIFQYYDGSDTKRISAQQAFIKEFIRQKTSIKYIGKLGDISNELFNSLDTNMELNDMLTLGQSITNFDFNNVQMFTMPGRPVMESLSYYIINREETEKIINEYFVCDESFDRTTNVNSNYSNYQNEYKETPKPTTTKKSYTKSNPSNSQTNIKKNPTPKP